MNKKRLFVFLSVLLILSIVVIVGLSRADNYANERIIRYVHESSGGKYAIKIHEVSFSLLPLAVSVDDLEFYSIDSTYIFIDSTHKILPAVAIKHVKINGISLIKALLGKDISISKLEVKKPNISMVSTNDSVRFIHWKKGKGSSNGILIKKIHLENGSINWRDDTASVATGLNLSVRNFRNKSPKNPWFSMMDLTMSSVVYKTPDGFYELKCDSILANYPKGDMVFSKVAIDPLINKFVIGHVKGHESDWDSLNIERLKISGFQPKKLLKDSLVISEVTIDQLSGVIFRDTRLKFPTIPDTKLPYENLSKFHGYIGIDSIHLLNSHLVYQEHVEGSKKAGVVSFNKLEAHGGPISNATGSVLCLKAKSKLMDKSWMNAHFKIPLSSEGGQHHVEGELATMDLPLLNEMFMYVAGANIESGRNRAMKFKFSYDKEMSNGEMDFIYDNLKVKFVNTEDDKIKAGLKESFMTFTVNTFVLQEENTPDDNFRKGKIEFERDPKKSIFNYWWKSLFSGIKSSTGFSEKKNK